MANKNETYQDQLIEKIRENYLSIALGLLVLLVAVSIVFRANDSMTSQKEDEKASKVNENKNEYIVKKGDSVSSIARDQLGSMGYTKALIDANQLKNPEQIEVGQKLILPDVDNDSDKESEEMTTDKVTPTVEMKSQTKGGDLNGAGVTTTAPGGKITGDTYTVQKGDTLFNIVVRAYNNSAMIRTVMRANRIWNANYIQSGMTLRLPR